MNRRSNRIHRLGIASLSVALAALVAAVTILALASTASAQSGEGPQGTSPMRAPTQWTLPDGLLQTVVPQGWESNDRLASDNGAVGFIHPSGMEMGQELPIWFLIERRPRGANVSFDAARRGAMIEGRIYGFLAADSMRTETADGHTIVGYMFAPSKEGHERSLAFMETPSGMLLFRSQALSGEVWKKHSPAIHQILKSLRFLAPAAGGK